MNRYRGSLWDEIDRRVRLLQHIRVLYYIPRHLKIAVNLITVQAATTLAPISHNGLLVGQREYVRDRKDDIPGIAHTPKGPASRRMSAFASSYFGSGVYLKHARWRANAVLHAKRSAFEGQETPPPDVLFAAVCIGFPGKRKKS